MDPLIAVGIFLFIIFILLASYIREADQTTEFTEWAVRQHFHFVDNKLWIRAKDIPEGMEWTQQFSPFSRQPRGYAKDLVVGTREGTQLTFFTYGVPDTDSDTYYAVVFARSERTFPTIEIVATGMFLRWWADMVGDTIQVGDEVFEDNFRTYSRDPESAKRFLDPELLRLIRTSPFTSVQMRANMLVLTRNGRLTTDHCEQGMRLVREISARAA